MSLFKTFKPCACNLFWTTALKAPRSTSLGCWGSVFSWMLQRCVGHNYIFYKIFIVNVFYQYLFLYVVDTKLTNWNCHMYWKSLLTDSHSTIGVLWRGEGSLELRVHYMLPRAWQWRGRCPDKIRLHVSYLWFSKNSLGCLERRYLARVIDTHSVGLRPTIRKLRRSKSKSSCNPDSLKPSYKRFCNYQGKAWATISIRLIKRQSQLLSLRQRMCLL